jgi:hypothetical protein
MRMEIKAITRAVVDGRAEREVEGSDTLPS